MADADVDTLSLKELKALIAEAGLTLDGCIEKPDIRARAREAQAVLVRKAAAPPPPPADGNATKKLGGYNCIVKAPADVLAGTAAADLAIIFLHGFGASNSDFADIPTILGPHLQGKRVLYCFPQAPSGVIGAAWWQIDLMGFMSLQSKGEAAIAEMIRKEPKGLKQARTNLTELLQQARAMAGGPDGPLPSKRVVIGGFSQGAMTALDVALQQPPEDALAGVVSISGAPIVVEQWTERLAQHRGLRVLLTHGMQDGTLPVQCTGWTQQLLQQNGAKVEYQSHTGGHELGGQEVIQALIKFVKASIPES